MDLHDQVLSIIDKHDGNIEEAAAEVITNKKLTMYCLVIALEHIKARRRAVRRRELRREIKPQFRKGKTTGSIVFTEGAKKRLASITKKLFSDDGWQIGEQYLRDFTRDDLLFEAARERKTSNGHVLNAMFYEALAEPMSDTQAVHEVWTAEAALKLREDLRKGFEDRV